MSQSLVSIQPQTSSGGFRVAAPRLGEVLSGALVSAFSRDRDLPADMADLLAKLDKVKPRH